MHTEGLQLNCHVYAKLQKQRHVFRGSSLTIVLSCLHMSQVIVQYSARVEYACPTLTAISLHFVSGIGAVVKVVDSHPCGWGSIPSKSCSFLIVSLSKRLSLYFMCSDQHVKYWMPHGFPLTSSLLLHYHVKQYTHIHITKF